MVTVLAPEGDAFTLTSGQEAALLASIAEADQGQVVDAEAVLRKLDGEQ